MSVGPIFMIVFCPGMGVQVPELGEDQLADVLIDLHGGLVAWRVGGGGGGGGGEDYNVQRSVDHHIYHSREDGGTGADVEKVGKVERSTDSDSDNKKLVVAPAPAPAHPRS